MRTRREIGDPGSGSYYHALRCVTDGETKGKGKGKRRWDKKEKQKGKKRREKNARVDWRT